MLTTIEKKHSWEIAKNYRRCFPKKYRAYVCRPPKGVVLYNKFEHPELLLQTGGRTYLTLKMQEKLVFEKMALELVKTRKAYYLSGNDFVVCGTQGEMYPISRTDLCKMFCRPTGSKITSTYLSNRYGMNSYVDWFEVYGSVPDTKLYACYLPLEERGIFTDGKVSLPYNTDGVLHGKGDFVVSEMNEEVSLIGTKRLVNGLVFADTFATRNWQECVNANYSERQESMLNNLPVLFEGY